MPIKNATSKIRRTSFCAAAILLTTSGFMCQPASGVDVNAHSQRVTQLRNDIASNRAAHGVNIRALHSNKCLDVAGGPGMSGDGTTVHQWGCLGGNQSNQLWSLEPTGDNRTYYIKSEDSWRCLDVESPNGPANDDGRRVQVYKCFGYNQINQRWELTSIDGGRSYAIKTAHNGKCLDVRGGTNALADGVVTQQWPCLGSQQTNQWFYISIP